MYHQSSLQSDRTRAPDRPHPVETRVIAMLRDWTQDDAGQQRVWNDLCYDLGAEHARLCLKALEQTLRLLRRHGWAGIEFEPPGKPAFSASEASLAAFVLAATEQRRDEAMQHALMLVTPAGMMDLMHSAERLGLPLLCANCRARVRQAAQARPLTFQ